MMLRYLPQITLAVFWLWSVVEASSTQTPRMMPRWSWVLLTLFAPGVGGLLWFAAGRPRRNPKRPPAPDDDQDFLKSL